MVTISVSLPKKLLGQLKMFVRQGKARSKAVAIRMALEKYLEDQAIEDVLRASREPTLQGDLDDLVRKIR